MTKNVLQAIIKSNYLIFEIGNSNHVAEMHIFDHFERYDVPQIHSKSASVQNVGI